MCVHYNNDRACRLGTITFQESAHLPTRVPPARKDSDALLSRRLSYVIRKPTVRYMRVHRLVVEKFCIMRDARAQVEGNYCK